MRRAYLYNQPIKDAEQMGVDVSAAFLDTPATKRQALGDLVDRGGLVRGDVLVVSGRSKLGKGQSANRIEAKLKSFGVSLEVVPVEQRAPVRRGKRRRITGAERNYCRAIWRSTDGPADAIQAISNKLGFQVDWNWCQYHLGPRGGPIEKPKEPKA